MFAFDAGDNSLDPLLSATLAPVLALNTLPPTPKTQVSPPQIYKPRQEREPNFNIREGRALGRGSGPGNSPSHRGEGGLRARLIKAHVFAGYTHTAPHALSSPERSVESY